MVQCLVAGVVQWLAHWTYESVKISVSVNMALLNNEVLLHIKNITSVVFFWITVCMAVEYLLCLRLL